jgi:PAS domain S-box-containing protein
MSSPRTRRRRIPILPEEVSPRARVVLVDDPPDELIALQAALEGVDAAVVRASSQEEMLGYLLKEDCACVLLGVRRPEMDGFETARLIRSRPATRQVPIIFVTGFEPSPEEVARAYALGAIDIVSPPVNPDALSTKVSFFVELFKRSFEARATRTRYDVLSQVAPVGIFHADADGDCLWVNVHWCDITGLTPEEASGKGWASALHPEDRRRVFDEWYAAAVNHEPFRSEYRFIRPDGRETWVLGLAKAQTDAAGRTKGYVGTITDITDRRRVEELERRAREELERQVADRTSDLARSRERLRLILRSSLDAVVTMDERGLITGWGGQAERIFGWPEGEILGKSLVETIIPPRFRDAHRAGLERFRQTGGGPILGKRVEMAALRRDGSEFPVEIAVTPLYAEGETSFSGFIRDLSEQRRAEELSDRLAAVVRSSVDAILTVTLDGTIMSWNQGAEAMFGYAAAEAIGRPAAIIVPEDRPEEEPYILEQIARGKRVDVTETVRKRKDGTTVDVAITVSPLRDHEGRVVGAAKIERDITERKRVQERARFLAEASAILSSSLDYESTITRIADFAARSPLSDWCTVILREGEAIRRVAVAHRDPAKLRWAEEFQARFPMDPAKSPMAIQVLQSGRPLLIRNVTAEILRANAPGEHFRAVQEAGVQSAMVVPMVVGGTSIGSITFISAESHRSYGEEDLALAQSLAERAALAYEHARLYRAAQEEIVRRKGAEDEVRGLNAKLEELVQERTAKLTEALRELESFSYSVAHDLRAPLRAMSGFARILLEEHVAAQDEEGRTCASRILDSAKRMDSMVRDLLEYSRVARQEVTLEPVDLGALVRETVAAMEEELAERQASVRIQDPFSTVLAHRAALVQALTNLLQNAAKFVLPGTSPEITLRAEDRGGRERLLVEDRGIGIAREYQELIFGLFQRLHDERAYPGTGIGLAIVRKVMERMGGQAGVDSEPGKGSRFWLELRKGSSP